MLELCGNSRCPIRKQCGRSVAGYTGDISIDVHRRVKVAHFQFTRDAGGRISCGNQLQVSK